MKAELPILIYFIAWRLFFKAQDAESKRGNVFSKIDNTKSNTLIQFKTILQNAERALHIEYEKENDRVKQEILDR